MPLTPDEEYLAEHCYGYGCWSACYWFIGPEQGMGTETVAERARAFREADSDEDGLCDCREFHCKIGVTKWHTHDPVTGKVKPQSTWNYHISLLNGYKDKPNTIGDRRNYQSTKLGMVGGETCIAELKGLSSRSSKESKNQGKYIPARVRHLEKMIKIHHPVFVVFYGEGDHYHWNSIAGCALSLDDVREHAGTMFAFLPHTNARKGLKRSHTDWIKIGKKLRNERERLGLPDRCIKLQN